MFLCDNIINDYDLEELEELEIQITNPMMITKFKNKNNKNNRCVKKFKKNIE